MINTIMSMSDTLDLQVIAEGVETAEHFVLLKANNCRHYPGYCFGKPGLPEDIENQSTGLGRAVA